MDSMVLLGLAGGTIALAGMLTIVIVAAGQVLTTPWLILPVRLMWILVILGLPLLGALAWFMLGTRTTRYDLYAAR
jgi:hypothetical protein